MRASFLAALAAFLLGGCTQLFFHPDRVLIDTPDNFGVAYEPTELRAPDGTALFGWFLPAEGTPRGTVLFLHGNAENISAHLAAVAWMPRAGFNVFALDYRGYGRSGGSPSLPGMQLDIDTAMTALLARPDVDPGRIAVFGQSLGASAAIYYVAHSRYREHVRALIADSPFSDYREISREKFAALFITWPLQWLPWLTVDNRYSPEAAVGALAPIPLLLIHGDRDSLVPLRHSQRLYELAAFPKALWVVPGAGHIQAMRVPDMRRRLTEFLVRSFSPAQGPVAASAIDKQAPLTKKSGVYAD